jgi:hypothetical protein
MAPLWRERAQPFSLGLQTLEHPLLFICIHISSDRWRLEDITTANRSTNNSKQNKLVRSMEQTKVSWSCLV